MALSREMILGANDLKQEVVSVPEWGGDVIVQTTSARNRLLFEDLLVNKEGDESNFMAVMVAMSGVDEQGNALFCPSDIPELNKRSFQVLSRIFQATMRVNGIGNIPHEETVKNSPEDQSVDLPSV